jgi:hypothetical protein
MVFYTNYSFYTHSSIALLGIHRRRVCWVVALEFLRVLARVLARASGLKVLGHVSISVFLVPPVWSVRTNLFFAKSLRGEISPTSNKPLQFASHGHSRTHPQEHTANTVKQWRPSPASPASAWPSPPPRSPPAAPVRTPRSRGRTRLRTGVSVVVARKSLFSLSPRHRDRGHCWLGIYRARNESLRGVAKSRGKGGAAPLANTRVGEMAAIRHGGGVASKSACSREGCVFRDGSIPPASGRLLFSLLTPRLTDLFSPLPHHVAPRRRPGQGGDHAPRRRALPGGLPRRQDRRRVSAPPRRVPCLLPHSTPPPKTFANLLPLFRQASQSNTHHFLDGDGDLFLNRTTSLLSRTPPRRVVNPPPNTTFL